MAATTKTKTTTTAMLVGVDVSPNEYSQWFPKFTTAPASTRVFSPAGKGLPNLDGSVIKGLPVGTIPHISHKDEVPVKDVGAYWTKLTTKIKLPAGRTFPWTFRHEGEDYPLDKYTAYWRELRKMWDDHPQKDKIELVNIHTLYPSRWKMMDWRKWMLHGVAHVDGWDCYPPLNFPSYEPPQSLFGLPIAAAEEFGMPLAIPEWGSGLRGGDTGDKRAAWFVEGVDYLATKGCRFVNLWCSKENLGGQFVDYRPNDKPTLAAWNAAFAKYKR